MQLRTGNHIVFPTELLVASRLRDARASAVKADHIAHNILATSTVGETNIKAELIDVAAGVGFFKVD